MRVLLIASLFPPVRHTGALRWMRLCRRLIPMGCSFKVISTTSGFWSSPHEDATLVPGVSVDRVRYPRKLAMFYFNVTHRLLNRIKKSPSTKQTTQSENAPRHSSASLKCKQMLVALLRRLHRLPQSLVDKLSFPHHSKYWAKAAVAHCEKHLDPSDYDVIIATHPYAGTLIAADELSKLWDIPWVADFRDPWTHDMQSPLRGNQLMIDKLWKFEGKTLESAAAVVSINRQMCDYINAEDDRLYVITNSYEPSDYSFERDEHEPTGDSLCLCYTGNIADDHEYRLFLDGMKLFQEGGGSQVVFNYYGGAFEKLAKYAAEIGLNPKFLLNHGFVKHEDANRKLAAADCGVVFGWRGPLAKLVSTGKIFDSLGVKLPILGICSETGSGMEDIILKSRSGKVLCNAQDIADWLTKAVKSKACEQLSSALAPDYSEESRAQYTTEKIAEQYLSLLESLKN